MRVIDSHIHCGIQNVSQPFEIIKPLLDKAGISGSCLFAPVEDIYDRYDRSFYDTPEWKICRNRAHEYLLELVSEDRNIYPYFFVWNDFDLEALGNRFSGIKWHHHAGEPPYRYDDPKCAEMIDAICNRKLPIVLEETFDRTFKFIDQVAGRTPVIIPHLGLLNGGFESLLEAGIWDNPDVFADTALAGPYEISSFLDRHGADRLIFGSDFPFGLPGPQLKQIQQMGVAAGDLEKICSKNILKLIKTAS
jgi:hypothetical protein